MFGVNFDIPTLLETKLTIYTAALVNLLINEQYLSPYTGKEKTDEASILLLKLIAQNSLISELYNINPTEVEKFSRENPSEWRKIQEIEFQTISVLSTNPFDVYRLSEIHKREKDKLDEITEKLRSYVSERKKRLDEFHKHMYL